MTSPMDNNDLAQLPYGNASYTDEVVSDPRYSDSRYEHSSYTQPAPAQQSQPYMQNAYTQQSYDAGNMHTPYSNQSKCSANDTGSVGWLILGLFIPLAGFIIFLVFNNTRPKDAKKALVGAVVGFIFNVMMAVFMNVMMLA